MSANPASHDHDHDTHSGEALTNAARATLEAAGERWTAMRAAVFDALQSFEKPASAYDIATILSQKQDRTVAPNSVYRILDIFVDTNIVRRVESTNAFIANEHPGCVHDCIFLICDACGDTRHIDDDAASASIRGAAEHAGFAPRRPVIEVHGRCEACS